MTVDDKRAFLCALRDLMVRHDIKELSGYSGGRICVYDPVENDFDLYDLGTVEDIEEEIKNLK